MENLKDIKVWPYNLVGDAFGITSYAQYDPLQGIDDPLISIGEACRAFVQAKKKYGSSAKNGYHVDSEESARRFCDAVFAVYRDGKTPYIASKECHISSRTYNLNIATFLNTLASMIRKESEFRRNVGVLKYGDISSLRRSAQTAIKQLDIFRNLHDTLGEMSRFLTDDEVCCIHAARKVLSRAITHLDTLQNIADARGK